MDYAPRDTSEYNAWGLSNSGGRLGKPGRYEDPNLFLWPSEAHTQFYFPLRMHQDASAAKVQNVGNPQAPQGAGFGGLLGSLATITNQLAGNIDRIWTNPDTGDVNFGTGEMIGRKFAETANAGQGWLSQARGMFSTGFPADVEPVRTSAAPGVGNPTPGNWSLAALLLLALIWWGAGK